MQMPDQVSDGRRVGTVDLCVLQCTREVTGTQGVPEKEETHEEVGMCPLSQRRHVQWQFVGVGPRSRCSRAYLLSDKGSGAAIRASGVPRGWLDNPKTNSSKWSPRPSSSRCPLVVSTNLWAKPDLRPWGAGGLHRGLDFVDRQVNSGLHPHQRIQTAMTLFIQVVFPCQKQCEQCNQSKRPEWHGDVGHLLCLHESMMMCVQAGSYFPVII